MTKRRYSYSYSPEPRRAAKRRKTGRAGGWILLSVLAGVVISAVGIQQMFAGRGEVKSFAADSPCWREIACSTERVESREESTSRQQPETEEYGPLEATPADEVPRREADAPSIAAYAVAVLEEPCGALVHQYNADERFSPASLTKIVTALVAAEHVDFRQTVSITVDGGALSAENDATVMGLVPGQSMSMTDLLYGMLLPSGNDAAIQIAEQVAGDIEGFAGLMNAYVKDLGLEDSQFKNPHGLDEPGHYASAFDMARLGSKVLDNPTLSYIVSRRSYQPPRDGPALNNLNLLLGQYPGALGVKTGYTDHAGQTLVAAAERGGRRYIVAILGSLDIFADATALLDWAFASAAPACGPAGGSQVAANP
jgi:D-alanyl-D-alanine carboxypeptidase (penicillin-binding protein 5/6)